MQRFFDIVFSGAALLLLAPLLIFIVLILRFTGEGEVFFRQQRVGRGGELFALIKFATMLKNSASMGSGTVTLKDDPRVLPLGKFLRSSKLNELPQLLNILMGQMSVIGPRPQTPRCFDAFPARSQVLITQVRPGLSGVGSIAFRDEEKMMHSNVDPEKFYDEVIMPYKGALEEWYVARQSLELYLKCILLSIWVAFRRQSPAIWGVFKDLPVPPDELLEALNYRVE